MTASSPPIGGIIAQSPDNVSLIFPLKHTEVFAQISGNLSRVEIKQSFENPLTQPMEAVYTFPLPDEAAVDQMEIKIGDRTIKGDIKKREEAQQIYQTAKRQGRTAGLLEQQRDNIFTQSLANIKPGEEIEVIIRYTDSLKFEKGDYEFVFPMVVGPRYIPGEKIDQSGDTDQVPDASKITPPIVPEGTRSGQDIGVTVEINAGLPISQVRSTSHQINITESGEIVTVKLDKKDTIPNKDLILRYQVSGNNTQATALTQSDERGGHFALYFIPAIEYKIDEIVAKDVLFLMDTSGSQQGDPLFKSQELMRRFINGLNPNDTFNIMDFANTTCKLSETPLANSPENRSLAINYVNQLQAYGGTELLNGILEVLKFPEVTDGRLRSIVLLTDGYIGDENAILSEVKDNLKPGNRLYSFGVGSSVNRFLINRIAEIGRGISRVVRQDEPTQEVAEKFFRQINNPVLTDINIHWEGSGETPEIYPEITPDLFAEQPLVLFGRKVDSAAGNLKVTGKIANGNPYEQTFSIDFSNAGNVAIAQLWGRQRIKHLMNQMLSYETKSNVEAVTDTALTYQLLSQYTAFVAVSDDVRVEQNQQNISVEVPLEMPEGVSYRGIVGAVDSSISSHQRLRMMSAPKSVARAYSIDDDDLESAELSLHCFAPKSVSFEQRSSSLSSTIEITESTGLDEVGIQLLKQHLTTLAIPPVFKGELVFELQVKDGRVKRIVIDEKASTLDKAVIKLIRQHLQTWKVPSSASEHIVIKLQLNS
ncbi:VIT domain-containing protein [Limnoraphis robusta]|uniref:VIT domain-containing protein n=1 Tax=Limnoraphis robusta CCNP1315 TaxID=3110306 RepID=A0ABU5TWQ9_9CYAN|nr:VIT domain-containing protein [Limnoraphis robusta]MEA5519259.1 VIT domain-containing protein [Limnoraphis robusta CCNP1315]MEA5547128.1 VIT domain-containing protein [Limnoraphis robusta CCNP1324]